MFWKKKKEEGFDAFKAREMAEASLLDKERLAWITWGEEVEREVIEAASKGKFECVIKVKMKKGVERDTVYEHFNPLISYLNKRDFEVLTEYREDTNELCICLAW